MKAKQVPLNTQLESGLETQMIKVYLLSLIIAAISRYIYIYISLIIAAISLLCYVVKSCTAYINKLVSDVF